MWRELKEMFIPMNYRDVAFGKLQSLKMDLYNLNDCTYEFYLLGARARLHETEQQRVSRYHTEVCYNGENSFTSLARCAEEDR
ncbi:hypothetical protein GIB67_012120 [Kingdonia uniflora]|uniref:Uncharacterized protein n=1 Tax=Kingdonia uniflora TaxID=39325 RepID=A0A7J7N948_9MAGN|nr:hypothetical protein GIB67_012120 [Kingdonia uniflora]